LKKRATRLQILPSSVNVKTKGELQLVTKIASLSQLPKKIKPIDIGKFKVTIGEPTQASMESVQEWLDFQQIGEKTIHCIKHNW
jgi:hypothetical protein